MNVADAARWAMCNPSVFSAIARTTDGEWVYGHPVGRNFKALEVTINDRIVQAPLRENLFHVWAPWAAQTEQVHAVEKLRSREMAQALKAKLPLYVSPHTLDRYIGSGTVDAIAPESHAFEKVNDFGHSPHGQLFVMTKDGVPAGIAVATDDGYDVIQRCEPPLYGNVTA